MKRRDLLKASAALAAAGFPSAPLWAAANGTGKPAAANHLQYVGGAPQSFDYAWLKGQARAQAGMAYQAPVSHIPSEVDKLGWDRYHAIRYRDDHALWGADNLKFRANFFHLGLYFKNPVQIYEVQNGKAQEIAYDPAMFDYGNSGLQAGAFPKDLGFAGFRVYSRGDWSRDVAAFLGASYFRAVGGQWQYGLSARGLAVDSGMAKPEEFPIFTTFWLERPAAASDRLVVYALLDSPSVAGAYRFEIQPGDTLTMDVDVALYPRKAIERLGVAPLTSMFQYGENDRRAATDWRPEIHDSDGLQMQRGNGEWVWRPLTNPAKMALNAFPDENPRGFGLLQRDRNFDHYQDDGVYYDRRPSLWVQPKTGWGKGTVELMEIPTEDETFDNIVAFWKPEKQPQPGQELLFAYRLHWGAKMPAESPLAHVAATRTGKGGIVGQKREYFSWRFVIDFAGGNLPRLAGNAKVSAVITVSRGTVEIVSTRPLDALHGYRTMFDLKPDASNAPIDLRVYLTTDGKPASETWLYQWSPPADRQL
ncbi:MAG: Glucans biosynthesis protein precursor [Herbaspirillum sp.]|jgi:glucans biosynthesis protein|nr:Glucans biosynthesis protein precursor [Herbaspirillum sp.]